MPSPTEDCGRSKNGQFAPGNQISKGNPHHKKVAQLRAALLDAVSKKDLQAIIKKLISKAKGGDAISAREVLDRTLGKPAQAELLQRIETLENFLEENR